MVDFETSGGRITVREQVLFIYVVFGSHMATTTENRVARALNDVDVVVANIESRSDKNANVAWVELQMSTDFIDSETAGEFLNLKEQHDLVDDVYFSTKTIEENNVLRRRIIGR